MDPRRCAQDVLRYAISAKPQRPLCTVTLVIYICVKPVWGNISPINPKSTEWFLLNCEDLQLNVENIPKKYASISANIAVLRYVCCVLLPKNTKVIN